jgi:Tfp pilus assembly protein PilF
MRRVLSIGFLSFAALCLAAGLSGCAASSKNSQQAGVHRRVGESYLQDMQIAKALAEFQKGLELDPSDAQLHSHTGLIFLLRQELDKAERYLLRAIELDSSFSEARNHLAVVYLAQNRPASALEQIQRALKDTTFVSTGKAYFNQGKAYLMLGETQSAVRAFETAIDRAPADIRPYLELASLHLKEKDTHKSAFAARRALEFYPADYRAWFQLGKALHAQGDRVGATDAFRKTQQHAPPHSDEYASAGSFLKLLREAGPRAGN